MVHSEGLLRVCTNMIITVFVVLISQVVAWKIRMLETVILNSPSLRTFSARNRLSVVSDGIVAWNVVVRLEQEYEGYVAGGVTASYLYS